MFVLCLGVTKITRRRNINDFVLKVFHPIQRQHGRSSMWIMDVQRTQRTWNLFLGRVVIFALNYFAFRDHRFAKQCVVICLGLTREDHQRLVTGWLTSGIFLWVHFRSTLCDCIKSNALHDCVRPTDFTGGAEVEAILCELHNSMFGGLSLKCTCLAFNSKAIMALNILCTGNHEQSIHDGIFGTAREAEYTPQLAQALQLPFWSPLQVLFNCQSCHIFHSIAGGKQPSKMTSPQEVSEFSYSGDEQFAVGFLLSIYLMIVYNNALWCNWTAINFSVCLVEASCFERQTERGREPSF